MGNLYFLYVFFDSQSRINADWKLHSSTLEKPSLSLVSQPQTFSLLPTLLLEESLSLILTSSVLPDVTPPPLNVSSLYATR